MYWRKPNLFKYGLTSLIHILQPGGGSGVRQDGSTRLERPKRKNAFGNIFYQNQVSFDSKQIFLLIYLISLICDLVSLCLRG
jgi:hypothetical protein